MSSSVESLKIRAKLYQKSKKRAGKEIPLKEALSYISKSMGFASWKELKDSLEVADILNPPNWSSQWNIWFGTKAEALQSLTDENYLIPYKKQFFICDKYYLNSLGLSENDPDLKIVGNDFSSPRDINAFKRLLTKVKNRISQSGDPEESR